MLSNGLNKETFSPQETSKAGYELGMLLPSNSIVCFFGDLGAGKTTFIKGLAAAVTGHDTIEINSPTFAYLNIYSGKKTVYHFDLYRLRDADEFLSMGFDDYLFAGGICCVEWSEKIDTILPPDSIKVIISHVGPSVRNIRVLY
jgi:tRNA threonylcarbamoyladenosine biosynthesis protein TsaE